ncbi:MAG TPA: hypothetical protein VKW78_21450 [Terriglobales bacterium]|nr:hypothetical protein [Terriglobales bacterium]
MNLKKYSGILVFALAAVMMSPSMFAENQPHMRKALEHLEAAKAELQAAERDKGGHRAKALGATNEAIEEVRAGINFDNKHSQKQSPNMKPVVSGQANGK